MSKKTAPAEAMDDMPASVSSIEEIEATPTDAPVGDIMERYFRDATSDGEFDDEIPSQYVPPELRSATVTPRMPVAQDGQFNVGTPPIESTTPAYAPMMNIHPSWTNPDKEYRSFAGISCQNGVYMIDSPNALPDAVTFRALYRNFGLYGIRSPIYGVVNIEFNNGAFSTNDPEIVRIIRAENGFGGKAEDIKDDGTAYMPMTYSSGGSKVPFIWEGMQLPKYVRRRIARDNRRIERTPDEIEPGYVRQ